MEKHFRVKWIQEGRACGFLWQLMGFPGGHWVCFLFSISLARWKCAHVLPKDEFFSAPSTERMDVLCFLSWKDEPDRRILILSHFSSWNSKSIIHNSLLEIHKKKKKLHFLLSLIYLVVCPERVRVLNVRCVLSLQTWEEKHSLWDLWQMLFVSSDWANPAFSPWAAFVRMCCSGEMRVPRRLRWTG